MGKGAKVNTNVNVPGEGKGTVVSAPDKQGNQEVWINHTKTIKVHKDKIS